MRRYILFGIVTFFFVTPNILNAGQTIPICGPVTSFFDGKELQFENLEKFRSKLRVINPTQLNAEVSFFVPDAFCKQTEEPGLFIGRIYDSDSFSLNGAFIGSTGSNVSRRFRSAIVERSYSFPKSLLRCGDYNTLQFQFTRIVPGRLGPTESCFLLQDYESAFLHAETNRFFRSEGMKNIGLMLLAMAPFFMILFWGDVEGKIYRRFSVLLYSGAALCFTLSGWFLTFSLSAEIMFKFNTIFTVIFLLSLFVFIAAYKNTLTIPLKLPAGIFALYLCLALTISNLGIWDQIYRVVLILSLIALYTIVTHSIVQSRAWRDKVSRIVYASLSVLVLSLTSDILRYFEVHNIPNTSPWFLFFVCGVIATTFITHIKTAFHTLRTAEKNANLAIIGTLASQVAHDIRSPLAALDNVMTKTKNIPEDERLLVRAALNRIKDIANNLIERNRTFQKATASNSQVKATSTISTIENRDTFLLPSLIEPLITEKRMQYRPKLGIEIDSRLDSDSYGLFAEVQATEFKRLLSNLINNSVEAMRDRGSVTLTLGRSRSGFIDLCVRDNGKGISPEILGKLGQRGETHGKEEGSGLGLYHAHTTVKGWGGYLTLTSKIFPDPDHGTLVTISLPQVSAPEWFVSELQLPYGAKVIVLDDDPSIHGIWQGRFDSLRIKEKGIEIKHFSTPEEITHWVKESPGPICIYLADFELLGHNQTGLDLIEELGIGSQSILVTSRFEERHVAERAAKLKVKLIPKSMAAFVPITLKKPLEKLDAILIDDDVLIHMTWSRAAEDKKLRFRCYFTHEAFLADAKAIALDTPLYIDANLGNGVSGEEVARQVAKLGFTTMHLATGYEADRFTHLLVPKGPFATIQGKEPPWGSQGV